MICVDAPAVPVHLNEPVTAPPVSVLEVAQAPVPVAGEGGPGVQRAAVDLKQPRVEDVPGGVRSDHLLVQVALPVAAEH